ncbi:MAG: DUF4974 domain-containing protein [Bacteroidetes bacterium]|nr:MAG: DUF4974 domain-containing protein [Bacteroidota bacterium]
MENLNEKHKELIIRMLSGEASEVEISKLNQWLQASEQNRKYLEEYKSLWNLKLKSPDDIIINSEHAWKKVSTEIEQLEDVKPAYRTRTLFNNFFYVVSGIAAVLLIFLGLYILLPRTMETEMITHEVQSRTEEPLRLADGTTVLFKGPAKLLYPENFGKNNRHVRLKGDAYFEVANQNENPFIIELQEVNVTVLGTSFYISQSMETNSVEVSVLSGKVELKSLAEPMKSMVLSKNERGLFHTENQDFTKEKITDLNFMAWKTGRLEFDQTNLQTVIESLKETYQIQIHARDNLSDLKLTARFINEKPEDIFKTISILFDVEVLYRDGAYVIERQD